MATVTIVIRLSEEAKTRANLLTNKSIGENQITNNCLVITVFEGIKERVESQQTKSSALLAGPERHIVERGAGTELRKRPIRRAIPAPALHSASRKSALRAARERHRMVQHARA